MRSTHSRRVRRPSIPFILCLVLGPGAFAPSPGVAAPFDDGARRDLFVGAAAARDGSVGAFVNPASWASARGDVAFWWDDPAEEGNALDSWGLSFGGPIGLTTQRFASSAGSGGARVRETTLGLAAGDRAGSAGVAWRWASGDADALGRESGVVVGAIRRPFRSVSLGASSFWSVESSQRDAVVEVAARPFNRPGLTIFADYALDSEDRPSDGSWSAGLAVRPVAGVHCGVRVVDSPDADPTFVAQLGLYAGGLGAEALERFDDGGDRTTTTYLLRANAPIRPLATRALSRGRGRYVALDLEHREIEPQRDLWFDGRRVSWIDLSRQLSRLARDEDVQGVVVNLAGTHVRPSLLWELRESLRRISHAGKEVIVHFDRASMPMYYLASSADRISIDPVGEVRLPGFALHRTYFRGLLEKLGLGFEEMRYFTYKSALETFSRSDMSPGDREQLGRVVEVVYETIRHDVTEERAISGEAFDEAVESEGILTAAQAKERGFVDRIGRWSDLVDSLRAGEMALDGAADPNARWRSEERWGRPPTIALVLAQGDCAMDEGIRGRAMSKHLERLAKRRDVSAVVFRADSPGGDPLPSDLVANAMEKVRRAEMLLVVNQGDLAASGGYLIGVEADRIFTTPFTITGSIGVISGWIWDAGLGAKAGIAADGVQRGSHADLFAGIRFPVLGVRLPLRPFTDEERERGRETMVELYDKFVGRVAAARGRSESEIENVAQGRVWMGDDAIAHGLCDEIGGLEEALGEAKRRAGLAPDEEVLLEEYPPRRRFRLPEGLARIPGIRSLAAGALAEEGAGESATHFFDVDPALRAVRLHAQHNGSPLLIVPPEVLPDGWGETP